MRCVHHHPSQRNNKLPAPQSGFSLIELLIVLSIIGILTTIALPVYQDQVSRSRRVDGKTALMMIMSLQERYLIRNNQYTDTLGGGAGLNLTVDASDQFTTENGFYLVSAAYCVTGDASCIVLTATPQGGQAADGAMTYNSQGIKTPASYW
ncbi:MAG: prepilin-type N-terminal cleavage/methylation domain-containing protein [Magnetococcales bacterium]|nr:prepilin-type N-terminal cleavage/methylation domain-containing protein [Magnetococcales bacterium]